MEPVRQVGQSERAGRQGQKEHPWARVAAAGRGQPAKTEGMLNARLLCSAALGAGEGGHVCHSHTDTHSHTHMPASVVMCTAASWDASTLAHTLTAIP